jgi:thiol peroxidase
MVTRPGMMVGAKEHHVQNEMLQVGAKAPDFVLVDNRWQDKTLADYRSKVKIISCVPSLDTEICSAQTRHFNEDAVRLGEQVMVLAVSADLPPTQRRWCAAEGIERVVTLSCSRGMRFADDYGVHDTDWGVCQRAVFVVDADDVVRLAEYVPSIGQEVNFETVLNTVRDLI